jgi:hypothetical protein
MLTDYIKEILDTKLSCDMILNIYLVSQGVRYATLLEYVNIRDKINIKTFYQQVLEIINFINIHLSEPLTIYKEESEPFDRLLICKQKNYFNIFYYLNCELDYQFQLGRVLEMSYPGNDFYNNLMPRLTARISVGLYDLFVETCIEQEGREKIMRENMDLKIKLYNSVLEKLGLKCHYEIDSDDGFNYRLEQIKNRNLQYITKNIKDYLNDLYNDFEYSKEEIELIQQIVADL